jgi:UDP-glucuronate 4-epimerase
VTPQRVLLSGAAGFIGSHLAERLLSRGDRVTGVDNFDPYYAEAEKRENLRRALSHPRFRLIAVDCADFAGLERALTGEQFDVCVHLAAKAGVRASIMDPLGFARANVLGTQTILEVARRLGVRRFVFASSSSVYGNARRVPFSEDDPAVEPISPYAATKRAGELLCRAHHEIHGGAVIALRFFTVYGPRQRPDLAIRRFATLMLAGEPVPMYGDGSTERDYTWIGDIVAGTMAAIDRTATTHREYAVVNLGGNRTTSLKALIDAIAKGLSVEPRIRRLPPQPGDVVRTWADLSRAERLLGYQPTTTLASGLPRFLQWLRERERMGTRPADAGSSRDAPARVPV